MYLLDSYITLTRRNLTICLAYSVYGTSCIFPIDTWCTIWLLSHNLDFPGQCSSTHFWTGWTWVLCRSKESMPERAFDTRSLCCHCTRDFHIGMYSIISIFSANELSSSFVCIYSQRCKLSPMVFCLQAYTVVKCWQFHDNMHIDWLLLYYLSLLLRLWGYNSWQPDIGILGQCASLEFSTTWLQMGPSAGCGILNWGICPGIVDTFVVFVFFPCSITPWVTVL